MSLAGAMNSLAARVAWRADYEVGEHQEEALNVYVLDRSTQASIRTVRFGLLLIAASLAFVQEGAADQDVGRKLAADRQLPRGLSASDWSDIRKAYDDGRHVAVPCDGGYQARNPGQRWRTRFDGQGFLVTPDDAAWSWGLELLSFGRAGDDQPVSDAPACIDAAGQRVEYEWDATLTEWYVNDPRGLEHGYTIHRRPPAGRARDGCQRLQPLEPMIHLSLPPAGRTSAGANPDLCRGRGDHADGPLQLMLAVRGGLRPQVSDDGQDVAFVDASGAAVVNYRGLKVFDADGQVLPVYFESSDDALRLTVDDAGARYPLTIDPIAQQAYLKASNTEATDYFGRSVAISGETVVVGAPDEDSSATGVNGDQSNNGTNYSGAAYVFVRNGGEWSQEAYLKASNTGFADHFGNSVAISGDTIVVGA